MKRIYFCGYIKYFLFAFFSIQLAECRTYYRNCRDLWSYQNVRHSGSYVIDVDGESSLEPITVECDVGNDGRDPNQVLTIVHHDTEAAVNVRDFEAPGSYVRNITYHGATESHLMALISASFSCQQYIKWSCKGSKFGFWYPPGMNSWWVGRNWKKQEYWGGAETDSRSCGCHPYCVPTKRNSTCDCDANNKLEWLEDSGLLLDSSRLPVLQLRFGDTGESNEAGQHILGPLICRTAGHRDIFMGVFRAPVKLTSPFYNTGKYPPPFHRYTWSVKINEGETMELVFPEYDVVHFGSYNAVPECRSIVTVRAEEDPGGEKAVIMRQKSPPYYASEGSQTTVNITFTTCNQDSNIPLGKGFKAYVRRTECGGCNPGLGQNGGTTYCSGVCGIIASEEYPFPHNYYFFSSEISNYTHKWVLRVLQHYVVELEFKDFDIPAFPGSRNCTPDSGILWIYNGESQWRKNLIGGFCNLNRQGVIHSNTNTMTLVFTTQWRKVGNGRGFHAIYRGVHQPPQKDPERIQDLPNIALGKPARQSSTRDERQAVLSVDGHSRDILITKTCSATRFQKDPWWQVNLQKRYLIYGVEIHSTKTEAQLKGKEAEETWPDGKYGLPMPVSGCPSSKGFEWYTGYRLHDMSYDIVEDEKVEHWSNGMLLKGGLQKKVVRSGSQKTGVLQYFCMKTENSSYSKYKWMPGEYCIFMYSDSCPSGFESGYISWYDKQGSNSESTVSGSTPRGYYSSHITVIYFCCRKDGNLDIAIKLPTDRPFYLFQFGKSCQKVEGMSEIPQHFHFNEDKPHIAPSDENETINGRKKYKYPHPKIDKHTYEKGIAVHYCYYDISQSLRGFRVTVDEVGLVSVSGRYYDDLSYGIPHTSVGDFLNAYTCMIYPVTNPEFDVLRVNCSQAIYGQYVTLQVFNRYDSLEFCEMKVFGSESCGQPLGMASEEIYDEQISATSDENIDRYYHTNGRLNAHDGWCATVKDPMKEFTIDLENLTTVTGVVLQGLNGAREKTYVEKFYLYFSNDSVSWVSEEEPVGQQKIYTCEQCKSEAFNNDLTVRFNLLKGISTRTVQIKILEYKEAPCFRLEIIGCRDKVTCSKTVNTAFGNITSPNYPRYYGQNKFCEWRITPEPGKHIELSFLVYDLAEEEPSDRSGDCRDVLTVYSGYGDSTGIKSPDGKLFPKRIISQGEMKIQLKTCFRYTLSRYRGFSAAYKFVDCPGCGIGDYQCPDVHLCESSCGKIMSIGYPHSYQNSHRCRWLIRARPTHFINLTFEEFDVVGGENCVDDYVAVYDGETNLKANLFGRYCNAKIPPRNIVSSWNALLIEFSTDAEITGRGLSLKYRSQQFKVPSEIHFPLDSDDQNACPPDWKYYDGYCYNAFHENEALQWYEAEEKCKKKGGDEVGHLVSILDKKENAVVHFFLTNFWNAQHKTLYIGLNDEANEGLYRWSDRNPMIYTDWAPAGRSLRTQPDGGAYQDCTMLRVDSGHSTAHWHDIPCSLGKLEFHNWDDINWADGDDLKDRETLYSVSSYICKMKSDRAGGVIKQTLKIPAQDDIPSSISTSVMLEKYFECRNKEIISTQFVCNGAEDCRDGSDEEECPLGSCLDSSFRCANGRCVSVAAYCDGKDDCGDQTDERTCDHTVCKSDEFQCRNGQCIPIHKRCDLLTHCNDKSDELDCRGACNANNTFQCYDGTCIPRHTLCDGHRDCPGKYHEDEQFGCSRRADREGMDEEKKLCSKRARRTCQDLYIFDNVNKSNYYFIDPDGFDGVISSFKVHCEMGPTANKVKTIIHHDSEDEIYVRSGRDGPGSYSRTIVYTVGMKKIKALIRASKTCRQYIRFKCRGTGFFFDSKEPVSWWISWDNEPQYTWGSPVNRTCMCYRNCSNPSKHCNCDSAGRFEWSMDDGYIEDKDKLPVKELRIGNTFRTGQEGYHTVGPLECFGQAEDSTEICTNYTQYMKCHTGHYVNVSFQCKYEFDQYGYHQGCRDVTHLRNCEDFECPKDYVKCPESYCIPTRYVCDGRWECIGGADEEECDSYNCPGRYKCYNRSSCLPLSQLCDGVTDCPHGDDELFCDLICPYNCICVGLYVACKEQNASVLPNDLPKEIRKLDFSNNRIDLQKVDFSEYVTLGELILQYNYLTVIPPKRFVGLRNLFKLDLSNNRLTYISTSAFEGLKNIKQLNLENNPSIAEIEPEAFNGLTNLPNLTLTSTSLRELRKNIFNGMASLKALNLKNNMIKRVETGAFAGLHTVTFLDIRGNDVTDFSSNIFTGLKSLEYLRSDSFTFCCMAYASSQIPLGNCLPPPDEISSCEDLMSSTVQRSFLWVLGILALLGNCFVIVWRIKTKDSSRISSTLVLSLGFADFLMGIYLVIIASVDVHYRSRYIENSDNWRKSTLCKICGFLSTVSSEVSIFTLVFITIDRLISLCFPLSQKRFSLEFTYKLIIISWVTAAIMATIPLIIEPYFHGRFYARSGVCLALHITNHRAAGWEYSVAIFFCINLLAFILIVSAYGYMYLTIKRSYHNMNRLMARQSRENTIGRQMALIVLTNSLCWFPIIVMGLLAMCGVKVTGEAYAWTAVFVLPLNSATNPLIYTISSLHFHTSMLSRFGLNTKDGRGSYVSKLSSHAITASEKRLKDQLNSRPFKPPQGYISLLQFLRTVPGLRPRHLLRIANAIAQTLKELHAGSYALGGIDVNAVFVSEASIKDDSDVLHVYVPDFNVYKIVNSPISGMPDDTAVDMEEFGLLVKKMLRVYHVTSRSNDPMQGTVC